MRTVIVGNAGSGKSTLARQLAGDRVPILDLDDLAWEPGHVAIRRPDEQAKADVQRFCAAHEEWVVEGCYGDLAAVALAFGPELIFLNPGEETCVRFCRKRPWEPHKYASAVEQDAKLAALLEWVSGYYHRDGELSLRGHRAMFDAYAGPKREILDAGGPV